MDVFHATVYSLFRGIAWNVGWTGHELGLWDFVLTWASALFVNVSFNYSFSSVLCCVRCVVCYILTDNSLIQMTLIENHILYVHQS